MATGWPGPASAPGTATLTDMSLTGEVGLGRAGAVSSSTGAAAGALGAGAGADEASGAGAFEIGAGAVSGTPDIWAPNTC